MERDRHSTDRQHYSQLAGQLRGQPAGQTGGQQARQQRRDRPWRPGETVLTPEDLRRVRSLPQIRELQSGIADMNLALWRIVRSAS